MTPDHLLIPTKFAPPRLNSRATPRAELLARLREARDSRLTLVCGNAGFGKTTLLAQWRQELLKDGERVAWLALSPEDRPWSQFQAYLVGALQQVGLAVRETSSPLPEDLGDLAAAGLIAAIVEAVANSGQEVFLFLDDYHHLEDPRIHAAVQGLLDHGPDELHLVLASRTHPPLSVSRMRMTGELAEVTFPDLPFTFDETRHFLAQHLGSVSLDDARLIQDITDGWPVCVQMICIRLKRSPTNQAVLARLLHRPADLQAYLAEDVVRNLAPDMIDFLEQVSVCRRFNVDLAREATGLADARTLLDQVERDNLFMLPVEFDSPTPWYRLHPLFANFLQDRLGQREPQRLRQVHARASRWFAAQGLLIEALRHAYHANDLEAAARLVEPGDPRIHSMSFIGTMQRWMDQLPPEQLLEHPRLLLLGCWALVAVCRWREAQAWLDRLAQCPAALAPELTSQERHLRASISVQRDDSEAALALIAPDDFASLADRFVRQVHLAVLGFAYCAAGRYDELQAMQRRVEALALRGEQDDDMALMAESNLLLMQLLRGHNRDALRVGAALVERAEAAHGRRSVSAINCAVYLADAHYESGQPARAREALANRLDLLRFTTPEPMTRTLIVHARMLAMSSPQEALRELVLDETRCRQLELDRPLAHVLAEQARLRLGLGEREAATRLQRELDQVATRHQADAGMLAEIPAIAALAAARLAIASVDWQGALAPLQRLRTYGEAYGRPKSVALADLLSGVALGSLGRAEESTQRLMAGVTTAYELGLVQTLIDEGPVLQKALMKLAPMLPTGPLRDHLVAVLEKAAAPAAAPEVANAGPVEAFKPREIEILRLVAQSMANKRIALTLNITLETVKWNLKNVFAKLGVSSRYDAMVVARKRGLID